MSLGRGFTVWQHQETGQFDRRSEPASGGCRQRNEPKCSVSQKCHGVQIVESQFAAFILGGYDPVAGRIRERRTEKRECEESAQKAPRRLGSHRAFEIPSSSCKRKLRRQDSTSEQDLREHRVESCAGRAHYETGKSTSIGSMIGSSHFSKAW